MIRPILRVATVWTIIASAPATGAISAAQSATESVAQVAELKSLGTTYCRTQSAAWLEDKLFAVGRWDGSIGVFRPKSTAEEFGPVLVTVLAGPAAKGIELVAKINDQMFLSSNNSASLASWKKSGASYTPTIVPYDAKYGVAVSATTVRSKEGEYMAVGHAEGYLSFWQLQAETLKMERAVSLRSPKPIEWQFQSWHIRGVAGAGAGRLATASEDGDICLVSVPEGKVLTRQRYNPTAQRGLNAVAVCDNLLAVVNCSIGKEDRNLWLFQIERDSLQPVDSINLIKDTSRDQVFAFSVGMVKYAKGISFLASTEEGLIWLGHLDGNKFHVDGELKVDCEGGAALAIEEDPLTILSAAHDVQLFTLGPKAVQKPVAAATGNK